MALPILRQEVQLPHQDRPRALPKAAPRLVSVIRLMRHNAPVECAAELYDVNHKTAFERRHRALTTVSGCQDRIVICSTVWVAEAYISDTDLSKGFGQTRKRGLSRQKPCICVVLDAVVCGHGKPSSARLRDTMGGRIAPGSLLIHDLEWAHGVACRSTRDGARPLFQVFADAYERQSVVITTNLEFSRWGSAFGDDQMAAVITASSTTGGSSSSAGSPTACVTPSCGRSRCSKRAHAAGACPAQIPMLFLLKSS